MADPHDSTEQTPTTGNRPATASTTQLGAGIAMVPGSQITCLAITLLTVMLAMYSGHPEIDPVLRTLYFVVLFSAFHAIRRREPVLDSAALRLVTLGFLVLALGFTASAAVRLSGRASHAGWLELGESCERGGVFLLGVSLITYGILLTMPALAESYRVLRREFAATQGELREVVRRHHHMESRILEVERYRALGELAAGVAHDLRNPLTIVKTAAEALSRKPRGATEVAEHCAVISRNIERAERTIAALLDLGKPRSLSLREHDLGRVAGEAVALIRPEARRRRITLEQMPSPSPIAVQTDQRLLSQALINLLLNALQATPAGGHVTVRTRAADRGRLAVIAIEDRGSGMAPEDRSKLFSPFFTTKEGGTGLGLLSCRRVLDELGGSIELFPRQRGGARAVVVLPARPVAAEVPCGC
ncbi:MAG: HAMP domain-containing histidine kinase [Planctomycetes bacterium]|nr:HAMP domain-containing histidine kinase [Planctomycetota bacterium]